jgi:hypothetical protein
MWIIMVLAGPFVLVVFFRARRSGQGLARPPRMTGRPWKTWGARGPYSDELPTPSLAA